MLLGETPLPTAEMDISKLIKLVRSEHEHQPSVDDQIRALKILIEYGYDRPERLTQAEIEEYAEDLGIVWDCADARPALDNLVELGLVAREQPNDGRAYAISERLDEIINGRFEEILLEDREALIDHIRDEDPAEPEEGAVADGSGATPRTVVADALDVPQADIVPHLRAGAPEDQSDRINDAIDALEEHDEIETRSTYGKIVVKQSGYRYWLTRRSIDRIDEDPEPS